MILRSHLGITNHLTRAFLLIIYMVRIVQIQVADNFAKRPAAANSKESLWPYKINEKGVKHRKNLLII